MKKTKYIYFVLILLIFNSCEKVIDLDLETAQERLVIQALIEWEKGTSGNHQMIKLHKTSSFYNNLNISAENAIVSIRNKSGDVFSFNETSKGIYETNDFVPEINEVFTLKIEYNNEIYVAKETLVDAPIINEITQTLDKGDSKEDPEINVFFDDTLGEENFYRIIYETSFIRNGITTEEYGYTVYDDAFEDGNELTDFNEYENILQNDVFKISLYGISERFSRYLTLINNQGNAGFDPFATPPVNVFGNCINSTNSENYPYGYFSLSEVDKEVYLWK